jgi:hypothetical protein
VPDEYEAINRESIGEIEDVLGEGCRLSAQSFGMVDVGGAEPAQLRDENAQTRAFQVIDDAIPSSDAVGKAVE